MQKNSLLYDAEKVYSRTIDFTPSTFCKLTASLRCMPDFFIGGVQKGGTTSLYYSIIQHPQIIAAKNKEIFYYGTTTNYLKGLNYYKPFFATKVYQYFKQIKLQKPTFCIEGSTNTIDSKEAPSRILKDNPNAKIVFIFRNPVERAFSHYKMSVKRGWELAGFEEALALEEQRIEDGHSHPICDPNHNYAYQRLGYLSRGVYVNHLKRWYAEFPKENILVTESETFFKNPQQTFNEICDFLKIERCNTINFQKLNEGESKKMNDSVVKKLSEYYKPFNEELFELLGKRFNW